MRKLFPVLLVLTLFVMPSFAQTAASSTPTTAITINSVNCGHTSAPLNCYSVPMSINGHSGTAWIATGFILFRPGLEGSGYVEAAVTSWLVTQRNNIGQPTQEVITFTTFSTGLNGTQPADPDVDGDADRK